ncbi:LEM domain-containing protein 1 isoform X2 [Trachinotus anak]|uniref:LEM domain-containing protein 1 isoform X2 n=1 Tax=Trachinotus anak TaxID=443729 RepID=UPI0039F193B3
MPVFVEDPAHLSKSRLKSDLVAHNVELPPPRSKKDVYVRLYLKHIDRKNAADFSSDEEDEVQDVAGKNTEDAKIPDLSGMTDDDLKAALLTHGVKAGPIVASTRALYEKKLSKLLQPDNHLNGAEEAILYSDSEEEEENGEEEDAESGTEEEKQETVEQSDQVQQEISQNGAFAYPQCFLPSSRLHARPTRNQEPSLKSNSGNVLKSSERSRSQIPVGIITASSVDQRSGLGSGVPSGSQMVMANSCPSFSSQAFSITQMVEQMESQRSFSPSTNNERELNGSNVQEHWSRSNRLDMPVVDKCTRMNQSLYYTPKASPHERRRKLPREPVKYTLKDMFPDAETTPTGIYATRRRPIKGAAGRPVQYAYPETPVSPTTLERREVERCLVPVVIQILVFLIVVCVLYLVYVCLLDNSFSPFVALLDSLNQGSDSEEGLLLQMKSHDTPAASGQE